MSLEEYESLKSSHNDFAHEKDREVLESDFIIAGLFALMDPLRDEIPDAVRTCHKAGINIRMVTGDNIDTAKSISVGAGLITEAEKEEEFVCMEGKTFREECGGLI